MIRDLRDIASRISSELLCRNLFKLIAEELYQIPDPGIALTALDRLLSMQASPDQIASSWLSGQQTFKRVLRLLGTSPFLCQIILSQYSEIESVLSGSFLSHQSLVDEAKAMTAHCENEHRVAEALRRFRLRWTLKIASSDLFDEMPLNETTSHISNLADACLEAALAWCLERHARKHGMPRTSSGCTCEIVALALGKLGGHELNYSSDVDLIFLYDEDGKTTSTRPISSSEFFGRVITDFLRIMAGGGSSSFILRVDLRLRPEGAQGPILMNLDQTLNYYDSVGRTWERQALIKVRPCAGNLELGHRFQQLMEPFVYRRYLTSIEIAEIKAMKHRIEYRSKHSGVDQWDVKTGFGGIRDIEFVVQFLQLLNGCTLQELRHSHTLETLSRLNSTGCLTADEFNILKENYIFLRRIEHRLQLAEDRQTHTIPEKTSSQIILSRLMNYQYQNSWESPAGPIERFIRDYRSKTTENHNILNRLLHDTFQNETDEVTDLLTDLILDPEMPEEMRNQAIDQLGFQNRSQALIHLQCMAREEKPFFSTPRCRHFFSALAPKLLKIVASTPNPDFTLSQVESVSRQIPGKVALWEFLNQNSDALNSFIKIAAFQKFTTELMISRSNAWEDWSRNVNSVSEITAELLESEICNQLKATDSPIQRLRTVRDSAWLEIAARIKFPITSQNTIQVSHETALVARTIVGCMANRIWTEGLARWDQSNPGQLSPGNWGIVALGKLGGDDLLFHSDIDLLFIHEVNSELPTNRLRQAAEAFFQDLASRLIRSLSEGGRSFLYRVDTRLRPFGNSGPLSVSCGSLQTYYAGNDARIWERLALMRAQSIYTQGFHSVNLNALLKQLATSRKFSWKQIVLEMRELRSRTLAGKDSARTDLKKAEGGVHEAELLVQLMQWTGFEKWDEPPSTNFWKAVNQLETKRLMKQDQLKDLVKAYSLFRQIELALRLYRNRPANTIEIQWDEVAILNNMVEFPFENSQTEVNSVIASQMSHVHRMFEDWLAKESS